VFRPHLKKTRAPPSRPKAMSLASAGTHLLGLRKRVSRMTTRSSPGPTRRSTHLQLPRPLHLSLKLPAGPTTLPQATLLVRPGTLGHLAKRWVRKSRLRPTATTVSTRSLVRPEAVAAAPVAVVRVSPVVADVVVAVDAAVPEVAAATARLLVAVVDVAVVALAAMATLPPGPRRKSAEKLQ